MSDDNLAGQAGVLWTAGTVTLLSSARCSKSGSFDGRVGAWGAMRGLSLAGIGLIALAGTAQAADLSVVLPTKAAPAIAVPPAYDWSGFYFGAHVGYALGGSNWSATQAGGPDLSGTVSFSNGYNLSSGTGGYLLGFQAGYDYVTASHWLVGATADVSFPSFLGGNRTIASPLVGTANYLDAVEFSGSLRGRVGYAPNLGGAANWLFYATGGLAISYDQFTRTQLAGVPAGGGAVPGTVENQFLTPRLGGIAGAGVEVALAAHWTAELEYLFTDYGSRGVSFPAGAQRFNSDLTLSELRAGLNYRFNDDMSKSTDSISPPALQTDNFAVHGQTTFLEQYDPPFHSPYTGTNSLIPNQGRETFDATAFLGWRLWDGAELWVNSEIDQGFGLSSTLGVAGFPSGEAYKVGESVPYARIQRAFVRQTFNLGGDSQKLDAAANQFSSTQTANRVVLTVGKFSVTDVFDNNKYAHDPRGDFMNWSIIDTGTFDYAADAWGYSYGAAAEWYQGDWTVRGGIFDESVLPNSSDLDTTFQQFQWVGEVERRYELWGQPGKLAVTGFITRGRMGDFPDAIALAQASGMPADITAVRRYDSRGGISVNLEQQIADNLGVFARAGWADGDVEPYNFADIDRTAAAGLSLAGKQWGRPDDTFRIAGVVNGITKIHEQFLNAGGLGILVGDGMLPHPGPEQIIETNYTLPVSFFKLTLDYQFIVNPGYNQDRGPASVIGARMHTDF
ncbi:MAG: carbohydrate porin [Xanthobacteraceae bacterium]